MPATRLSMRDEVVYIIGNRTELNVDADKWVQRAYHHITQAVELPEAAAVATIAMIIGTRAYTLPADYFSVYSVRNVTTNKRMYQVENGRYDALSTVITQPPDRYTVFTRTLNVHPTPDATDSIQVRYRKVFADLSTDATAHVLPDIWDEAIIMLASAYGFDHLNEIERSRHYKGQARSFIREQTSRLGAELLDRNEAISVIGGEIS